MILVDLFSSFQKQEKIIHYASRFIKGEKYNSSAGHLLAIRCEYCPPPMDFNAGYQNYLVHPSHICNFKPFLFRISTHNVSFATV